eukprot:5346369-Pleurochrysis_carterae.AAC.4
MQHGRPRYRSQHLARKPRRLCPPLVLWAVAPIVSAPATAIANEALMAKRVSARTATLAMTAAASSAIAHSCALVEIAKTLPTSSFAGGALMHATACQSTCTAASKSAGKRAANGTRTRAPPGR